MTPILQLQSVSRYFGGLAALLDVSFELNPGEIVGLIGPNGAGKTTLVNLVTGVYRPNKGQVIFDGKRIDRLKSHTISRSGIARTFQVMQPFPEMTVVENVAAGALFAAGADSMEAAKKQAMEHIEFVGLGQFVHTPAASLALPNRKRLELAKSLAMNPKLLLLDEVMAGLNSVEIDQALELIRRLREKGLTILLIEHVMKVVMSICSRVVVLHHGSMICEGDPETVVSDSNVVKAYLGARFVERQRNQSI